MAAAILAVISFISPGCGQTTGPVDRLRAGFLSPPDSARPGVYWYFMDGNMSARGMLADLESMRSAGIGSAVFLEVNVGVPRGPVDFLSDEWFGLFRYMEHTADSLGIALTLGVGPGWAGSGGPWITAAQSMQELVSSSVEVSGPGMRRITLPVPSPKPPYFGMGSLTPPLDSEWRDYYRDVAVLCFPTPDSGAAISDIDEKALYYRAPFSSRRGVKPFLNAYSPDTATTSRDVIRPGAVMDLTGRMAADGTLDWKVPPGKWTVMRFSARGTGAVTRPAPVQGLGFESSKFDTAAVDWQLHSYVGKILRHLAPHDTATGGGLKMLHLDSWEMGSQNWSENFRREFTRRRGYDPLPFYPAYAGRIVGSRALTERFLWDLRLTAGELVIDHYARRLKKYAHAHGLGFSVEPYDMNPSADLDLGAVADVPMAEFWSRGYGFSTAFSCIEAASVAHVMGRPLVQGEAFTANATEAWKQYPGSMKDQGDWAFAAGINKFYYHTFAHKPYSDSLVPGMTMGPYGVHWDRKQTWWPMVGAYHRYIARCQYLLQQGRPVADVLYLTPEGAPQVFIPPASALAGDSIMPDRRGYNFDGCSPLQLKMASVRDHRIVFPGGASYRLLVLPARKTMSPQLLAKIDTLLAAGAVVVGAPPVEAPGLSGYPSSDSEVRAMARRIWGAGPAPATVRARAAGKGKVFWGGAIGADRGNALYPDYAVTSAILRQLGATEDFRSGLPLRYTHRAFPDMDIYFVSNRSDSVVKGDASFRVADRGVELWDPVTGKMRPLKRFTTDGVTTTVPLRLDAHQSFFVVFRGKASPSAKGINFPLTYPLDTIRGPWTVAFDPRMGGPATARFDTLGDWTRRPEQGIRYYSGIAVYQKHFDAPGETSLSSGARVLLDLGGVKDLARVRLNGRDLGVVWTPPYRVEVTGLLKARDNTLEISVANRWPNRLIGDAQYPGADIKDKRWPAWLLKGEARTGKRYTFTNYDPYTTASKLLPSGLLGPVVLREAGD